MPKLKNILSVALVLSFLATSIDAQPSFQTNYINNFNSNGSDIEELGNNGYLLSGMIYETSSIHWYSLLRLDGNHDILWTKAFSPGHTNSTPEIIRTSDGGFLIAGESPLYTTLVIKTDANGDTLWTRTYTGATSGRVSSVVEADDGGFVVYGDNFKNSFLKISSAGAVEWAVAIRGMGGSTGTVKDQRTSVVKTSDNGYVGAGVNLTGGINGFNGLLSKTDDSGNVVWARFFGGNADDCFRDVIHTHDNGFIAVGYSASFGAGSDDIYIVKTDSAGNLLWSKVYGQTGDQQVYAVHELSDGSLLLHGFTGNYNAGTKWHVVMKTTAAGDVIWSYKSQKQIVLFNSALTADGGLAMIGFKMDSTAGLKSVTYLMKTDSLGITCGMDTFAMTQAAAATITNTNYYISDSGAIGQPATIIIDTPTYQLSEVCLDIMPCEIGFSEDTTYACPPFLTQFFFPACIDTSTVQNFQWCFGDGVCSTDWNPFHNYVEAGCFTVTLYIDFLNVTKDTFTSNQICVSGATGNITLTPDTGCAPLTVLLDANSSGAVSHFWICQGWGGGVLTDTIDTHSCTYSTPGVYFPGVVLTDSTNPSCSYILYSDEPVVVLNPDTIISDFNVVRDTACVNESVQFTDASSGGNIFEWEWDFGDGSSSGLQHPAHAYHTQGNYTVELSASGYPNCHIIPVAKEVFIAGGPQADFSLSTTEGCEPLLVSVSNESLPGDTPISEIVWDFGDALSIDDTSSSPFILCTFGNGQYSIELMVTDSLGCADTASAEIDVYGNPNPSIFQNGNMLSTEQTESYQWYFNGSSLKANGQSYEATESGTYFVIITDANGCTGSSDTVIVIIDGMNSFSSTSSIKIYPNPASDFIFIESDGIGFITMQMKNVIGETIFECGENSKSSFKKKVDLSSLVPGIYSLHFKSAEMPLTAKILVF